MSAERFYKEIPPATRYLGDTKYRYLVDVIVDAILSGELDWDDLRDAIDLADEKAETMRLMRRQQLEDLKRAGIKL